MFSCIWVESCKISSSRFWKPRILTFPVAIFRVSYTGNEPGKWPKMAYFWPKMAKIGQNLAKNDHFWIKNTIFWPNSVNKREENTKNLEIFNFWVQKCQKMGYFGPKVGNFDFENGHFQKSKLSIFGPKLTIFGIFGPKNWKFPSFSYFLHVYSQNLVKKWRFWSKNGHFWTNFGKYWPFLYKKVSKIDRVAIFGKHRPFWVIFLVHYLYLIPWKWPSEMSKFETSKIGMVKFCNFRPTCN